MTPTLAGRLPAQPLEAVLKQLAAIRKRTLEGDTTVELPSLSLLVGPHQLESCDFLDYDEPSSTLLVSRSNSEFCYLPLASILSLHLHLTGRSLPLFSLGRVPSNLSGVPTRLALQRRLAALEDTVGTKIGNPLKILVDWDLFPKTDGILIDLDQWLAAVEQALMLIARDVDGQAALRNLARIRLSPAESPSATHQGPELQITAQVEADRLAFLSNLDLVRRLESIL